MYQIRTRCSILQVLLGNMLAVTSYLCAAPTIDDVESRVIASRMAIKSARLEISDRDVESPDYFQTRNWSVYWDERNQRVDTRAKALSGPGVQQTPTAYQCSTIVCFAGEDYYSYTSSNPNCVLTVNKKAEAAGKTAMIINPRHLGTNPLGICFGNSFHLRSFVGAKQRSEEAIVASKWKGLNAWNIRYKMTDGSLLSYVAVPELGYSIVEIEQRYELEGRKEQHQVHRTTINVQQHSPSGLFYPTQIDYKGIYGGTLRYHSIAEVKVVSLNVPLDPDFFSPKTMSVPQGTYVMDLAGSSDRQKMWDGEKIVTLAGAETVSITPAGSTPRRTVLICSSILLVILSAIFFFLRQYRKRAYR